MKIVVFSPTSTPLSPDALIEQPLGGADTAFMKMIRRLAATEDVTVFGPVNKFYYRKREKWYPYMDAFTYGTIECDVLIVWRKLYAVPQNIKAKKVIFYSQDAADAPAFNAARKEGFNFGMFDRIVALSHWHADNLREAFGLSKIPITIIGNAADPQPSVFREIPDKKTPDFIYCSTPFRGLVVLAKIWPRILDMYPDAMLHVFSSMKIYKAPELDEAHFQPLYDRLRNMEGVQYYGTVTRDTVIDRMRTCDLVLYPNTFPETYCNVAMEARSCRVPIITTRLGALPETVGQAGILVDGNAYTQKYQDNFVYAVQKSMNDRKAYMEMAEACYPIRTWENFDNDIMGLIAGL